MIMNDVLNIIEAYPIVPIFYNDDITACINAIDGCYKGGVRVFEFVNRGPLAKENFEQLIAHRNEHWQDLKLGIGTIKNKQEALDFIALKADFIVSPLVKKEIAKVTLDKGILWIPGAMTPTEIDLAQTLGAPIVKLFPGDVLRQQFVKAVKPLFYGLKFMATGGVLVEENNLKSWFSAGVTAVGAGSKLFENINNNEELEQRVKLMLSWISVK